MAYKQKTYRFPNAIEVEQYHTAKYGNPGEKRLPKKKATPEEIEKRNQYNREKLCRRKMRANFKKHDCFVTLTYRKEERPEDMEQAKKECSEFLRRLRKEYKKCGAELKWIRNIEVGTKGGWHVHLIVNRIEETDLLISKLWLHGKAVVQLMFSKGEFAQLAAYMVKTPKTDPRLREASYSTSRNLPIPEPEEKVYIRWRTWKEIKVPEGWYLDEVQEGINPVTGFAYRSYVLLRIRE